MSTEYLVHVIEATLTTYWIDAESPEEAENKWRAGEYDLAKERGGEVLSVEVETAE
jgi:hypothetical protein